ncbi:MAG: serine hydrolase domain-containing protein [Pseudomonadales bacterium]
MPATSICRFGAPAGAPRCRPLVVALLWLLALPAAPVNANADAAALAESLWRQAQAASIPAMALVIVDGDRPAFVSVHGDGADLQTPFRWGSITKVVTALTLLELARDREVALTTPVAELLQPPPFDNPWEAQAPLRIEHLLELTAGLADLTPAEFDDNRVLSLAAALADRRRLLWPPGLHHSYSNVAAGFSQALIEQLSGRTYAQAAAERVFRPLGIGGASFVPDPRLPGGFQADGSREIPYWNMTFPAFGALNAPPAGMARLVRALLHQGRVDGKPVFAADTIARLYRTQSSLGPNAGLEIGYGAGLYGWASHGQLFYGHGGDADGYRSRLGLLPDAGRGYLLVVNADNPRALRALTRQVEAFLARDLAATPIPPPGQPEAALLERLAGRYYPAAARFGVSRWQRGEATPADVLRVGDELRVTIGGRTTPLLYQDRLRFRRPADPAVSVVFAEHEGDLYLQGELGAFVRIHPGRCPAYIERCEPPPPRPPDSVDQ